jgi:tetratricopeptide (TPR) repeat protein
VADSRIDELRRRLEREPGSRLFAQLAEEHRKAGNHAEAIRIARTGLVHHPSYPSARLTLGRALLDSGDAPGARAELEAALRDAPDNILASRFLGQALEAVGELGPALLQLQKTLKMAPGDRQLESQIVALQTRLRAAPPPAPAPPVARTGEGGQTAPLPRTAAAPPEDTAAEPLAPTIRIHMPGDQPSRSQWSAAPPPLPAGASGSARPSPPGPPPASVAAPPPAAPGDPPPAAVPPEPVVPPEQAPVMARPPAAPLFAEPFYESDVAPTLPTAQVPSAPAVEEEPPPPALAPEPPTAVSPPEPLAAEETVFEEETGPEEATTPPLASSTLAELYYRQGLADRAIDVYRQLLAEEPGNEKVRERLAQIESGGQASVLDPREARRRALERTIAGLEALLAAVRRR